MKKKKKKKDKNHHHHPQVTVAPEVRPSEVRVLEGACRQLVHDLQGALAPPQAPARPPKGTSPFPAALGQHLLQRLLTLEAAAGRLADAAERRGDHKTALRAVQVNTRIITAAIRLVTKHPHLGEDWQPDCLAQAVLPPVPSAADPGGTLNPEAVARQPLAELDHWLLAAGDQPPTSTPILQPEACRP